MFKQQIIEQLSNQIKNIVNTTPLTDLEHNIKAILKATFEKLDLVSREEFDIQQKVLTNTRTKLEELEHLIKELERKLNTSS